MNLILIAVDTLRADHLGCYGYSENTSPEIDATARGGTTFINCFSQGNCTHPGFTTIITGLYPISHDIVSHWTMVDLDDGIPTLPEILRENGYRTAAVDNLCNRWANTARIYPWFKRGYEDYLYPDASGATKPACDVTDSAIGWLHENKGSPFFLFVHYWDTHAPYNPPEANRKFYREGPSSCDSRKKLEVLKKAHGLEYDTTDMDYIVSLYDGEINYVSGQVGRLIEKIEELGIAEETFLVITSDHGEILKEYRRVLGYPWCFCHIDLYDECLRVPLVVSGPGIPRNRKIAPIVQHIDITPTMLSLLDVKTGTDFDGEDLTQLISGKEKEQETVVHISENTYQRKRGIRTSSWKFMINLWDRPSSPRMELYNVLHDPGEEINLVDKEKDLAEEMKSIMESWTRDMLKLRNKKDDPLITQPVRRNISPRSFYHKT